MTDAAHSESAVLRVRYERFSRLRAAWRALAPSIMAKETGEAEAAVRALRGQLQTLAERNGDPSESDLSALDGELERYAQSLRVSLDHVPVAQLRSTLPDVESSQRDEVLALLDLVLEDEAHLRKRMAVADYLVTLLSTEEQGHRRRIMHDPVGLTARLCALSERLAATITRELEGAEQGFFAAVRRLEEGDLDRVLRDMRNLKNDLGLNLFLPEVLRGLVFYNTSFWNRIRSQIEADRAGETDARADDADLPAELAAEAAEEPEPPFEADAGEGVPSVFEAKGLRAVAQALARWALGEELGRAPAERVAVRLDLASLSPAEHSALSAAGGGLGGDAAQDTLVLTLVVGLVLRSLPIVAADLAALRIDRDHLQRDWLRELDGALRKAIGAQIAGNGYALARSLSEARNRYLFAPLAELNREARVARGAEERSDAPPEADEAAAADSPGPGAASVPPRQHTGRGRAGAGAASRPSARRGPPLLAQIAALALVAAVGVGAFVWKVRPGGSVRTFSKSELQLVSTQLDSGYRDRHGTGGLFVGTVDPTWKELSPAKRLEKAKEMVKRLKETGVRQVMLFDRNHRLEVQYSDGQPVQVLQ